MKIKFIEAHNNEQNWGKFMLQQPDTEHDYDSAVGGLPLLRSIGWGDNHLIVFDLQTCEGAAFLPGGSAAADLQKHKIWVCPMFEPFLEWLYQQAPINLDTLPAVVNLPEAEFQWSGYRREGQRDPQREAELQMMMERFFNMGNDTKLRKMLEGILNDE